MSTFSLISLSEPAAWAEALSGIAHGPAHEFAYCAALQHSTPHPIVLCAYKADDGRAACPVVLRPFADATDIATPYGFSGFATNGACGELPRAWQDFAETQGWVCGYVALHPFFAHPFAKTEISEGKNCFLLNLACPQETLLANMQGSHAHDIRRDLPLLEKTVADPERIKKELPSLYVQTLARVGAQEIYKFKPESLAAWVDLPGTVAIGIGERTLEAVTICLSSPCMADYFINASTDTGRKYARILLWAAICELKKRRIPQFNMGGGATSGDGLETFKRRFGGQVYPTPVLKQVYNSSKYVQLCKRVNTLEDPRDYFPSYRRGAL